LEFGHAVTLRTLSGTVQFKPIPDAPPTRVPFTYADTRDRAVSGALRLKSPAEFMAIEVVMPVAEHALVCAWVAAVTGYAELTCVESSQDRPEVSDTLRPTAQTRAYMSSYVAGHRRRLGAGQQASDVAHAHTRNIGITLADYETWVRPDTRGVPADADLVFDWPVDLRP
jgi:hypothetical protein